MIPHDTLVIDVSNLNRFTMIYTLERGSVKLAGHSPFAIQWQMSKVWHSMCEVILPFKFSCSFFEGGRVMMHFLGGQRYFVRNSSNSRWNASYVDGICQAVLSDIPERSCSSFGRGKVMISFLEAGKTILCVQKVIWYGLFLMIKE